MGTEKEKGPVSDMEMYLMPGLSFLYFNTFDNILLPIELREEGSQIL